jgi:2,4-dienoyl-CoA reductase-like NADH-dependent reductase (Old Yellow Enzyme family)
MLRKVDFMDHTEFNYKSLQEIIEDCKRFGINLKFSDEFELFKKTVTIGSYTAPNSIALHPMEGCDGKEDGSPDELTLRRYERFAKGGAGLIWVEAVAVVPEGRASNKQLWIHRSNVSEYKRLYESILHYAHKEFGKDHTPLCILQLTHSGRFRSSIAGDVPIIACENPYLEERYQNESIAHKITDEELEALEDHFVEAAVLAKEAGFHGVDVKACHRYLNSELLSAYTREGKYGGSFEGRTKFLLSVVDKIKARLGSEFIIASRINIYDGIPYPYGFGVELQDATKLDLTEPIKLIGLLQDRGVRLINLTMGTPYYNPHVNRPYDKGGYIPPEHPLEGVSRLIGGVGEIQKAFPNMIIVSTGYSWMRQFSAHLGAGSLKHGLASMIGFGREAFAYPDFAKDILTKGQMNKTKCCIACGKCASILRAGGCAGCVIRDSLVYAPIFKEYCK